MTAIHHRYPQAPMHDFFRRAAKPSRLERVRIESRAVWAGLRQAVRSHDDMLHVLKILAWVLAFSWIVLLPACAFIRALGG